VPFGQPLLHRGRQEEVDVTVDRTKLGHRLRPQDRYPSSTGTPRRPAAGKSDRLPGSLLAEAFGIEGERAQRVVEMFEDRLRERHGGAAYYVPAPREVAKEYVQAAIQPCGGEVQRAARQLGISTRTIHRRLAQGGPPRG
jgi:DNA-binding NtrC family response regulator